MASGKSVNLQEKFTCPICLELLTEPLSLDCGHSFCQACNTANNKEEHYVVRHGRAVYEDVGCVDGTGDCTRTGATVRVEAEHSVVDGRSSGVGVVRMGKRNRSAARYYGRPRA